MTTEETKPTDPSCGDPDAAKVELDESASIIDIIEELEALSSFRSLEIFCFDNPHQTTKWTSKEAEGMYKVIGQLEQLESLTLSYTGHLPVRMLRVLLSHPQLKLKHLCLKWVLLEEEENDGFAELAPAIQKQRSLQSVELIECHLAPGMGVTPTSPLDTLITAFVSLPQLESLVIQSDHTGSMGLLTSEAIEAVCRSATLQTLDLTAVQVSNHQIVTMARALLDNKALLHLYLGEIHLGTYKAFSISSLIHLDSTLKCLHFKLPDDHHGGAQVDGFLIDVANALIRNASLKELHVGVSGKFQIGPRIEKAFAIMLNDNDVLQSLRLNGYNGPSRRTIDFYLRLNRLGRRHLIKNFENISRPKQLQVLSKAPDDLDILPYLTRHSSLCKHDNTTDSHHEHDSTSLTRSRKRKLQEI